MRKKSPVRDIGSFFAAFTAERKQNLSLFHEFETNILHLTLFEKCDFHGKTHKNVKKRHIICVSIRRVL